MLKFEIPEETSTAAWALSLGLAGAGAAITFCYLHLRGSSKPAQANQDKNDSDLASDMTHGWAGKRRRS